MTQGRPRSVGCQNSNFSRAPGPIEMVRMGRASPEATGPPGGGSGRNLDGGPPGLGGSEVSEEVQNRPGHLPRSGEKIFGRWVLKIGRWVFRTGRWVFRTGRWVFRIGRWVFRTGRWVFRIGRWVMGRVGRWVSGGQQVPRGRRRGHPGSRRAAARSGAGGGGEGSRRTR